MTCKSDDKLYPAHRINDLISSENKTNGVSNRIIVKKNPAALLQTHYNMILPKKYTVVDRRNKPFPQEVNV